MSTNTKFIERARGWIDTLAQDVAVVQKVVESSAPREARKVAAGALNYLVTRLDLIPDWEETCGVIDDAIVQRVALGLASEKDLDLAPDAMREVARLANEADVVLDFLGPTLYPALKKYVQDLADKAVRGRTPDAILDDEGVRKALYTDIAEELKRLPPAPMTDPEQVARTVHNYLSQKLK